MWRACPLVAAAGDSDSRGRRGKPRLYAGNSLFLGFEIQRCGVHAIAQPGRFRAVRKDVTEMGVTVSTAGFGAGHAIGAVGVLAHIFFVARSKEAGPAGTGFEFGFGIE